MDYGDIFKSDVPTEFLTKLGSGIFDAYLAAKRAVDDQILGPDERYNLMPMTRRAHVETQLRNAATACGIETTTESSGFWNHVVINCGRIRITQSSSPDSSTSLRPAAYKRDYAQQQLLFPPLPRK
ncbi:MAG: hypothetical protein SGI77_10400 [Pirellulaceae bacterium]|nr:hypothetical protein [Pirellulaceae bacterium]